MRFLCRAVLVIAVLFATMPVQAATVLSDAQIEQLQINGFVINDVDHVVDSSLAIQNNIGAVVSHDLADVESENKNVACVNNVGNSAMALQNNIGAVVGLNECSNTQGAEVENSNSAVVINDVVNCPATTGIEAVNFEATGLITFNEAYLTASAAAFQNNIGVILTSSGQKCGEVEDSNRAFVVNNGSMDCSAAVAQNNIGAAISLDSFINGLKMCNLNIGGAINGLPIFSDGDMDGMIPGAGYIPTASVSDIGTWTDRGECLLAELRANPVDCPDIIGPDIVGSNLVFEGLTINPVDPVDSAVVEQNNLGVAVADTCVTDAWMSNVNLGLAVNVGNSAAALQNNIGVILAEDGLVSGSAISNLNGAAVVNILGCEDSEEPGIDTENVLVNFSGTDFDFLSPVVLNGVVLTGSAAALQNNIAAIIADDVIACSLIDQVNAALVVNIFGDSAFALQSNIGVIYTPDCAISDVVLKNCNLAAVANIVGCPDGVTQTGSNIDLGTGLFLINPISIEQSAAAVQNNIGVILTDYLVDGACMLNSNKAFVYNAGNSAAAVQSNIGAILTEYRIDGAHISNENCADVDNEVTVPIEMIDSMSAITATNINILPINPPTLVQAGAYAQQSNIGVVYAPEAVSNSCVSNFNSASVSNSIINNNL